MAVNAVVPYHFRSLKSARSICVGCQIFLIHGTSIVSKSEKKRDPAEVSRAIFALFHWTDLGVSIPIFGKAPQKCATGT